MGSIIEEDLAFISSFTALKAGFDNAFEIANEFRTIFEPIKATCLEDKLMDINAIKRGAEDGMCACVCACVRACVRACVCAQTCMHGIVRWSVLSAGELTLDNFNTDLLMYNSQIKTIESLPANGEADFILIDTVELKRSLVPFPSECVGLYHEYLPTLAANKYQRLMTRVNHANNRLSAKFNAVDEFVSYLQFLEKTLEEQDSVDEVFDDLSATYALLDQHSIHVADVDRASYQMLIPEYQRLRDQLEICDADKDENIANYSKDLAEQIDEFEERTTKAKVDALADSLLRETDEYAAPPSCFDDRNECLSAADQPVVDCCCGLCL